MGAPGQSWPAHWRFFVEGRLCKTGQPVACDALVDSADDVEGSPYRARTYGPPVVTDGGGRFWTWLVTEGDESEIRPPADLCVRLLVARGRWAPFQVSVSSSELLSACEMELDLGDVEVPADVTPVLFADVVAAPESLAARRRGR